ncbi:hypothetical protein ACFWXK_18605 [Streptomyces sp. NPDC059070]|uniref:hypothetical protein n=1 Tax=unclassified Streptomyces TaxID=2593676 RepID=UPI0034E2CA76
MGIKDEMQDKARQAKERMQGARDEASERGAQARDRMRDRQEPDRTQQSFDDIQDELDDRM